MTNLNKLEKCETIEEYIKGRALLVQEELANIVPSGWEFPSLLRESMEYSLMAGGKRLRPILALAACEALGGNYRKALPAACAAELIHTYSLVHDDLPAMDDDDYRRGKLTNHKVYGEGLAILAGDGLLTHAFYSIVQGSRREGVPADRTLAIVEELAILAGAKGMVGGQAADLLGEQGITGLQELQSIHARKTGDMIVYSLKAGGHCAGATEAQLRALEQFGYQIGLAFQIQDDILDLTGNEAKLGKPLKSDEKQMKVTYPFLLGLEPSIRKVAELTEEAQNAILAANFPEPETLLALADYLMKRDH